MANLRVELTNKKDSFISTEQEVGTPNPFKKSKRIGGNKTKNNN